MHFKGEKCWRQIKEGDDVHREMLGVEVRPRFLRKAVISSTWVAK